MRPLAIVGVGVVTPLGPGSAATSAALRAGLASFDEMGERVDGGGEPIVGAAIPGYDRDSTEAQRALARQVCEEALAGWSSEEKARTRVTLSIACAEEAEPESRALGKALVQTLELAPSSEVRCFPSGHAAGILALAEARERAARDRTALELVLGIDSLLTLPRLDRLERMGRLKSPRRPRGAIAGEAMACLAVQSEEAARISRRKVYCRVEGMGLGTEPVPVGSEAPCLAQGMTEAVRSALASARWDGAACGQVYIDLNGEEYRAHEWMLTVCRLLSRPHLIHPADCMGDVGAASAPLLVAMAARALDGHHAWLRTGDGAWIHRALVVCSSDGGARGALCLSPADPTEERPPWT